MKVTSASPKKSGGSAGKIIAIILVLAIVGAAAGWYFILRSTPEKTMKLMLEASEKKDTAAVKALFCAKDRAAMPGGEMLPMGASPGEKPKYKIGTSTITGDKATIPVTFEIPKGSIPAGMSVGPEMPMTFVLVKEEGTWKVDMQATMMEMFKASGLGDMMKGMGDAMNEMPRPGRRGPARQLPRRVPEEYKIRKRR